MSKIAAPSASPFVGMASSLHIGAVRRIYETLLLCYLFFFLFFYPYGFFLFGEAALRVPDIFAISCTFLGVITLLYSPKLSRSAWCLWPIIPLALCEILFPLIGVLAAGAGASGLSNSLRMILIWAPMALYIVLFGHHYDTFPHKRITHIFVLALMVNIFIGATQILYRLNIVSEAFIITTYIENFVVDEHYRIIDGFRISGSFSTANTLGIFGLITLIHCISVYEKLPSRNLFAVMILASIVVTFTLSRSTVFALILIILTYVITTRLSKSIRFIVSFSALLTIALIAINHYIGLDIITRRFEVFYNLESTEIMTDSSLSSRTREKWPQIISNLGAYPLGTLTPPGEKFGVIDSGYLTYYAQGRWPFLLSFFFLLVPLVWNGTGIFKRDRNRYKLALFFLSIYLTGAMVALIPTRTPLIIFMLTYWLWSAHQPRSITGSAS